MNHRLPRICCHRGYARVWLGRWVALGKYGSPESKAAYRAALDEWRRQGCPVLIGARPDCGELAGDYLEHLKAAKSRDSLNRARLALRSFLREHADRDASTVSPACLDDWRMALAQRGLYRSTINERAWVVKDMIRWAVRRDILPAETWHRLSTVTGLRLGEYGAKDRPPVRPVPREVVNATLPHLPAVVADMVQVQLLTGARPGEVCRLCPADLDTSGRVWVWTLERHKTAHHGKARVIAVGPKAQAILSRYLKAGPLESPLFRPEPVWSPTVANVANPGRAAQRAARRAQGFTGKREPKGRYTTGSYRRAVERACIDHGLERWSPNRLRHTRATEVRRSYGLDAASAVLGHSKIETTQVYAERAWELAERVARATG